MRYGYCLSSLMVIHGDIGMHGNKKWVYVDLSVCYRHVVLGTCTWYSSRTRVQIWSSCTCTWGLIVCTCIWIWGLSTRWHYVMCTLCIFTARSIYASMVLGIIILSVRHTRALWRNERTYCQYFDITRKVVHSSFLTPRKVGGRWPLSPEMCA